MTTAIIGTGGIGSAIARELAAGGEKLRLASADQESDRYPESAAGDGTAVMPAQSATQPVAPVTQPVQAAHQHLFAAAVLQRALAHRAGHDVQKFGIHRLTL